MTRDVRVFVFLRLLGSLAVLELLGLLAALELLGLLALLGLFIVRVIRVVSNARVIHS